MTDASMMLDLDAYAAKHGMSTRTVRRALDADQIAGAVKVSGRWAIPADAVRQVPQSVVVPTSKPTAPTQHPLTVGAVLDTMPVFLDLETAARLLGLDQHVIRANAEYFGLVKFGEHTAGRRRTWVMPKARIRELNGD